VIDYVAPTLDSSTGTISIRAVFPNSDGFLRAGYFVRVRVPVSKPRTALLVAEQALGMDQGQYYVLVVNDRNKVEYRRVRTGILDKGMRVIEEGLSANEHVIVIGLQRVRPGAEVKAETVSMESVTQVTTRPAAKAATKPAASTDTAH
jgi:RND family efflux transporter MFP subunit